VRFINSSESKRENTTIYEFLVRISNEDPKIEVDPVIKECVKKKFVPTKYKIRADIDIRCFYGGIVSIKDSLSQAHTVDTSCVNSKFDLRLKSTPVWSINLVCFDREKGLELVRKACEAIEKRALELRGEYKMVSEPKVIGDKGNKESKVNKLTEEDRVKLIAKLMKLSADEEELQ
jgi:translation initiation factor 2 alpha subunit (eIF-2alpha)